MGYGVSNINFFYRNWVVIIFFVSVVTLVSIDSVTRYFALLTLDELRESVIYGISRIFLFIFLVIGVGAAFLNLYKIGMRDQKKK